MMIISSITGVSSRLGANMPWLSGTLLPLDVFKSTWVMVNYEWLKSGSILHAMKMFRNGALLYPSK